MQVLDRLILKILRLLLDLVLLILVFREFDFILGIEFLLQLC